jgi:hypothetical protein
MEVTAMISRKLGMLLLSLTVWLVGCPGSGSVEQTFSIEIQNRTVPGDIGVIRVNLGDMVTLWWATDETATIHLHGYDIEQVVKPGVSTVFTFKAYATGRYPITVHSFGEPSPGKAKEETPLVYLEVLPR